MATPDQVIQHARADWEKFRESHSDRYEPKDLFELPTDFSLNMFAADFLRHCTKLHVRDNADAQVMFFKLSTDEHEPSSRPASWLCLDEKDAPVVVVDDKYVREMVPVADYDRTVTRLILHEVGHVVEHWSQLAEQAPHDPVALLHHPPPRVAASTSDQEREAWWYAAAVVGFALGDCAYDDRMAGGYDRAWSHS